MSNHAKPEDGLPAAVLDEARDLCRAAEVLPNGVNGLAAKIHEARSQGRVLRVKLGVDPTSSDLHLGHTVVLRALRRFQDRGHKAVLIVGGFTAQIGDPTGRNNTRPALTAEAVAANAATYLAQVGKILDLSSAEVLNNADWLAPMDLTRVLKLASQATVNQLLAKEGFGERIGKQQPVGLHELFYPLLQGFDSVAVRADVEIGGSDQRFNMLAGRQLQAQAGQPAQVAMLLPILEGVCGVKKMSKSLGNAITLTEAPEDVFAKCMRLPDSLIVKFFELATTLEGEAVEAVRAELAGGGNPKDAKEKLAHQIVLQLAGAEAASRVREEWRRVHSEKLAPADMPSHVVATPLPVFRLLVEAGLAESNNQARKLIAGGGVRMNAEKVADPNRQVPVPAAEGVVLQVGRRKFVRLVPRAS